MYVIGLGAMLFTASSYVTMARAFPVAGFVYSYAGRGIGPAAGFLAGWHRGQCAHERHHVGDCHGLSCTVLRVGNMASNAQIVGLAWLALGMAVTFAARAWRRSGS